jgi:hypothetical protein
MRYTIAEEEKARKVHITLTGHIGKEGKVVLNEKELTSCSLLTGDLTERASQLGGEILEYTECMLIINEGGWNIINEGGE